MNKLKGFMGAFVFTLVTVLLLVLLYKLVTPVIPDDEGCGTSHYGQIICGQAYK